MKTLSEIDFGADVSLYRSAADTLQTNDTMVVGGPWGMQAKPIGRVSIACPLSDDRMLGVGSVGGANQFNTTNTVIGIGSWPQNGGIGQVYGLVVQPCGSPASATINQIWGAHISVRLASATATLNNGRALFVGTPSISAGGIITNAYGVEINPQATTGVTNAYGIYQRGTTDSNVLLGNTGMGVTAPTLSRLQFPAGTLAVDGITWGTDVNLYRSAANVLQSDDQVSCVGINLNQNEAQNLVTHKLAAAPASPVTGQRYYDTALKVERYWDGTVWVTASGGGTSLPPGGSPGQVLMKQSAADGDALWKPKDAYVGIAAPPSTPNSGDLWWDSDEVAMGTTLPLGVVDGGTGATSPATARASLAVPGIGSSTSVAGPPTVGTWARGDQWLDSAGVVWTCVTAGTPGVWKCPPTHLFYNAAPTLTVPANSTYIPYDFTITLPRAGQLILNALVRYYMSGASTAYNVLYLNIGNAPGGPVLSAGYDEVTVTGPYPSAVQSGGMVPLMGMYNSAPAGACPLRLQFQVGTGSAYSYVIYTVAVTATLI